MAQLLPERKEQQMEEVFMTGKEIYTALKVCKYIRVTTKVYKDWIFSDRNLVGFVCHVNSNLGKQEKIKQVREWIANRGLPLEIIDETGHLTRIKAVIKK